MQQTFMSLSWCKGVNIFMWVKFMQTPKLKPEQKHKIITAKTAGNVCLKFEKSHFKISLSSVLKHKCSLKYLNFLFCIFKRSLVLCDWFKQTFLQRFSFPVMMMMMMEAVTSSSSSCPSSSKRRETQKENQKEKQKPVHTDEACKFTFKWKNLFINKNSSQQ